MKSKDDRIKLYNYEMNTSHGKFLEEMMAEYDFDVIVKIGSMALIRKEDNDIDYNIIARLAKDLSSDGLWQADMRKDENSSGRRLADKEIIALRNKAELWYTWYVNISAIFPLLGILGTVIALIGMQGDAMTADSSFLLALTSTFWGLIFSIVFKSMQTLIEAKLDEGVREAERCLGITRDTEESDEKA